MARLALLFSRFDAMYLALPAAIRQNHAVHPLRQGRLRWSLRKSVFHAILKLMFMIFALAAVPLLTVCALAGAFYACSDPLYTLVG